MHQIAAGAQRSQIKGSEVSDSFTEDIHLFIEGIEQAISAYMAAEPSPQSFGRIKLWRIWREIFDCDIARNAKIFGSMISCLVPYQEDVFVREAFAQFFKVEVDHVSIYPWKFQALFGQLYLRDQGADLMKLSS